MQRAVLVGDITNKKLIVLKAYGKSIFEESDISNNSKIKIFLNKEGKYLNIYKILNMEYSLNRLDYKSDEIFSNFRLLKFEKLKEIFYRGASPIDNKYNRANITDKLLEKNNIKYIINLTNNNSNFNTIINKNKDKINSYTYSLYKEGKIYFADLNIKYNSIEFQKDISKALFYITEYEGPFYIHCVHGRDRTAIACMLLEALAGCTYDEILEDYMITYENYYNINEYNNKNMYNAVLESKFKDALYYITKEEKINDFNNYNYQKAAENYLKNGGLTNEQISTLKEFITR